MEKKSDAWKELEEAREELDAADEAHRLMLDKYFRVRLVEPGQPINSGEAIVGNVGSKKRMEFTVVGDVVNVAARLEAVAKPNQVLVGEATHALAGEAFDCRSLGKRNLTGRKHAVSVFELQV